MLNMPILKFEKSCNYLEEQLTIQNNNKQLLLDIISNVGLILNDASDEKVEQYDEILEDANEFLKTISSNITSIEQLNLEIKNITQELTDVLTEQKKTTKTKEFYIAAFSNIKHNVIIYSKKFQEMETKLSSDNSDFNEFINKNNFKYNFVSLNNSTNTYSFIGFSVNDTSEVSAEDSEVSAISDALDNDENQELLDELNELSNNEIIDLIDEIDNTESFEESPDEDDSLLEDLSDISSDDLIDLIDELDDIDSTIQNVDNINNEDTTDTLDVMDNTVNSIEPESEPEVSDKERKINQLTSEFKEILMNLSETNFSSENTSKAVISLFKDFLPEEQIQNLNTNIEINEQDDINSSSTSDEETPETDLFDESEFEDFECFSNDYSITKHLINDFKDTVSFECEDIYYYENTEEQPVNKNDKDNNDEDNNEKNELIEEIVKEPLLENSDNLINEEVFTENDEDIKDVEESVIEEILSEPSINTTTSTPLYFNNSIEENIFSEYNSIKPSSSFNLETFTQNYENEISNKKEEIEFLYNEVEKLINIDDENSIEPPIKLTDINSDEPEISNENDSISVNTNESETSNENDSITISTDESETSNENDSITISTNESETSNENDSITINTDESETLIESNSDENNIFSDIIDNSISLSEFSNDDLLKETILDNNNLLEEALLEECLNSDWDKDLENSNNNLDKVNSQNEKINFNASEYNNMNNYQKAVAKSKNMTKTSFQEKLLKIQNATEDNKTLLISERLQKIYLPYKISELVNYIESYPGSYTSLQDVVEQEFILPFDYFKKHPSKARFTETYNLLKNREGRNFIKSVSYAFRLLKKNNLNPAIIASCKTQHELDSYIYYLDSDNLNNFKFFNVIYEVNPM